MDYDFGPWIESTASTRLSRYRYDYANSKLVVEWRNGRGHIFTTYELGEPVDPDDPNDTSFGATTYRKFAIAVSKGRYVNTTLNPFGYEKSTPEEINAPSNVARRAVKSIDTNSNRGRRGAV